jgi:peptide/nickel transport system permease protein
VLAAWHRNKPSDQLVRFLAVLGMGLPNFFLAVLLIQLFAVELRWLPVAGPGGLRHLTLPAVVLCVEALALNMRLMRSAVLEELSQDYIRTLRAKGLTEGRIVWVHALRNALTPVVALAGVILPTLLGYTLIVETIFRYEGLGYQLVQGIIKRDYALAQTLALLLTATVILFNFLADVAHQLIDPRVRERARAT